MTAKEQKQELDKGQTQAKTLATKMLANPLDGLRNLHEARANYEAKLKVARKMREEIEGKYSQTLEE